MTVLAPISAIEVAKEATAGPMMNAGVTTTHAHHPTNPALSVVRDAWPARIATVALFYQMCNVLRARRSATWLSNVTCSPPPYASNGT
jgi:hypothetical protein